MRRADEAAISSGVSAAELMERAGRALAQRALALAGRRYGTRALVLCGPGNNGGDGLVAARILAAEGMTVECVLLFDPAGASGPPAEKLRALRGAGVTTVTFAGRSGRTAGVVVDAIFGTGFRENPEGDFATAISELDGHPNVVAADIPSGVDGLTGSVAGRAVRAAITVAMGAEKLGSALAPGAAYSGIVEVADIGIPVRGTYAWLAEDSDVAELLPARPPEAHKRSGGSVAVLAGSEVTKGAALLTCRGAERAGSGYVTLGSTHSVVAAATIPLPGILTVTVADEDVLGPNALDAFLPVLERASGLAIGPGLGTGSPQRALVERVVEEVDLPLVLDADALNVLAEDVKPLVARSAPAVVTPHPAELGRLLGMETGEVTADRLAAARRAAERLGCTVLAKGPRTVVADPEGNAVVVPAGGPELATAGTGDVLTGVLTALVAAGLGHTEAAWCAAYLHGAAGEAAASSLGAQGVVAWDVAEALPKARRRFTLDE